MQERSIQSYADLDQVDGSTSDPPLKRYSFYSTMLVHTSVARARQVLTDYQLYSKLIPYIDEATYNPQTQLLQLRGGIWKFKLSSLVRFEERSDRWIHFKIIGGHFMGLVGDIFFESEGEKGTLVYLRGEQTGTRWPPAFIIERGAEIVFEFTARRMRSYLESETQGSEPQRDQNEDHRIPQPRAHL